MGLRELTIPELREVAEKKGIQVKWNDKKLDILEKIEALEACGQPTEEPVKDAPDAEPTPAEEVTPEPVKESKPEPVDPAIAARKQAKQSVIDVAIWLEKTGKVGMFKASEMIAVQKKLKEIRVYLEG